MSVATKTTICNEISGHCLVVFVASEPGVYKQTSGHFQALFVATRPDIRNIYLPCLWQQNIDILNVLFRQFPCWDTFLLVVGTKPGISTETLGHFPATFLATKIGYFEGGVASLESWLCVWQSTFGHFQAVFAAKTLKTLSYVSGNKTRHSQWSVKTFPSRVWSKNYVPLALTKRILCLNLTRPQSSNYSGLQNRTLPTSITVIVLKISINLDSSTTRCITSGAGMDGEHGWRTYAAKTSAIEWSLNYCLAAN